MSGLFCCCLYPSRIVCVDDDHYLLKWITLYLNGQFVLLDFEKPLECARFVKEQQPWPTAWNLNGATLDVYVEHLHELMYDARRTEEISTLVVDCYMPDLDGLSFCKMFKATPYKKIMLTGETDQAVAVGAFNAGIIQQFVMKGTPTVMEDLRLQIALMQRQYFIEKSDFLSESLVQAYPDVFGHLADRECCKALGRMLQHYHIKEVYVFNSEGDYVMIDKNEQLWWLSIKGTRALQNMLQDAESEFLQDPSAEAEAIFKTMCAKSKLPLFSLSKQKLDIAEWASILAPAKTLTTAADTYQVLLARDLGRANLRYADIQFV